MDGFEAMLDLFTLPSARPRHGRDIPDQTSLFPWFNSPRGRPDEPAAVSSSSTSRAAGRRVRSQAASIAARVAAFVRERGPRGATDHEIASELGILPDTARSRRVRLRDEGAVVDSGRRPNTPSGCRAVVWVAAGSSP